MKFNVDEKFIVDCFKDIVGVPSPVGYYVKMNPVLEKYAAKFGKTVTYDNKSTAYITLDGEDNSKTVLIGAHVDTLGMVVRTVEPNGMIRVRQLGGLNFSSLEGETVTVHTRGGKEYTGLFTCQSHSVHVFDDARTLPRDEDHMMVILDENIKNAEDIRKLGIRNGDFISIDPRCQVTENGYIKSRFIDDKGAVACCFATLKYLTENNLKPKYKTILAFPYSEEIGMGGTFVPAEVSEYIAVDIGLIGPGYEGNEYAVSICAKDAAAPYDYELTNRLIGYAEKAECDYAVDIYYHYGTDANAAVRAGNNLRAATFGMAVWCSHGMERTHISGLLNTANLLLAYVLDI
ncbi:MAG: M42 family metallopeptidase [Oscillospiraceae bacterium]|nr:M42 family metallopeptidase [Oscillospiraceae bacterium]